ncbi:3379_t:CDS:2, partial [Entrophospora sp. SA101]
MKWLNIDIIPGLILYYNKEYIGEVLSSYFLERNQPEQSSNNISFLSTYSKRSEINQGLGNVPSTRELLPPPFEMWHPSKKLQELSDEFEKKILYDRPSVPCAYCSVLMMRAAVKWIDYDLDETYDIMIAFPDLRLPLRVNNRGQTKIAVCSSCKSMKNHRFPPTLAAIPEEI